jgi:polysaccharide export outer membrane protein
MMQIRLKTNKGTFCAALLLATLLVTQTAFAQALEPPKSQTSPVYTVQPNDVLEIFVWKDPTMSRKVTVRPDGRISFPLLQDMQAAGLNPEQLKQRIEEGLKQFVEFPNVTVVVDAILSYKVFVTGKVSKPGPILDVKPITVLQALAQAGTFLEFAELDKIVIIRGAGEDSTLYKFNYPEVIQSKNFSQNMLLRNGDVVIVP